MSVFSRFSLFLVLMSFAQFASAQNTNYNQLWKQVSEFENDGLPKSALKVVEQISAEASAESNSPQYIKALLFKSKYALILEEEAQLTIVQDFKSEIEKSENPEKQILQNMLATMYWQYFQQHRYQFYNRSNTAEKVDENDFRTWDLQTLFNEIQYYYKASLAKPEILQNTPVEAFSVIISEQKGSKNFRPTLYDILAQNALEFFKTSENSITKPTYKFEIDNPELFATESKFCDINLQARDSTSLQLNALKIYQDLTCFYLQNENGNALVDVDIDRLNFVKQNGVFRDKDEAFLNTLKASKAKYSGEAISALYDFEIANLYVQQGRSYNPKTNFEVRWKLKETVDICNAVIRDFPKSRAADKCESLKKNILNESLNITSKTVIPENQFSRFLVKYTNIKKLKITIYDVGVTEISRFNDIYNEDKKLKFLRNKSVAEQWSVHLKSEGDYQNHSTEIIVPRLKNGHYIILAETGTNENTFATQTLQVTDFALVDNTSNDLIKYQIINRKNGTIMAKVSAELKFQTKYNGSYKRERLVSNEEGFISLQKDYKRYQNLSITLKKEDRTAYYDGFYTYRNNRGEANKINYNGFLFTDRSIYRPGQTVYFKGITMSTIDEKSEVLPNEKVKVILRNVNYEEVKTLELLTNGFGSVSGEFILPTGLLTGQFTIELKSESKDLNASYNFSVEEYKRPKFEANFKAVTETFKVNDSVKVTGKALAYAGSNITDAKVVYRVTRKVQYPRWYYYYRPWFSSEPQEISYGETTTNDKGEFEINFLAQPDKSVAESSLPVFNYEIIADVTDINGETRSATTVVNVGYHSLLASVSIGDKLDKTKKDHKIYINTRNLNGEFVAADGTIKIYKLKAPNRVLRPRPWNAPDYQVIPKAEFKEKFPHEAYADEANPLNWEKGNLVFESDFDTSEIKEIKIGNIKKWNSGKYIAVLESEDKFGQSVKDETRFDVFGKNDKKLSDNELFSISTNKESYKVGNNVEVTLGTSAKDMVVTLQVEKDGEIGKTFIVPLSDSKQTLAIPVNQEDVGGFAIHYSTSVFNSFIGSTLNVNVPYPKTDLEIETLTFRDKLQPGTDETWSFKIKGPKGDKVSAELLASMYDASLDQFKPHNWSFDPLNLSSYRSNINLNARQSFGINTFRVFNQNRDSYNYSKQNYSRLDWFGFYFGNQYRNRKYSGVIMNGTVAMNAVEVVENESDLDEVQVRGVSSVNAAAEQNLNSQATGLNVEESGDTTISSEDKFDSIKIRKNLQETAFFFPKLNTDSEGNVSFRFTTPEALTKWKLQLLAYSKSLKSAVTRLESVTQKELMVIPNVPRFLRHGDEITVSTKIANLTEKELSGEAKLILTDAISGKEITSDLLVRLSDSSPPKGGELSEGLSGLPFKAPANSNTQVSWQLKIPDNIDAVQYKILATTGVFSDGEQNALPVLSNRILVTETLPMWIKSNETKTFTLDKLKTNSSLTLKNHKLTLEMTSNPAWYAVQALPYLMEYPYDCNEQVFSRYYANALASHVANSNPRIKEVFDQWANTDALLSNLEKNDELKSILIQETPWLRDAQSETEQKKRIGLLFDMNKMKNELENSRRKLKNSQMNNGAWPWFNGGRPNRFITQHIISGFGHLKKLSVIQRDSTIDESMIKKAITYLDSEFIQEYKDIKKYNKDVDLSKDHLSYTQLHYLYMRSFFPQVKKSEEVQRITDYYQSQIQNYWLSRSLYAKGLMSLVTKRMDDDKTADKILNSLKETSITSEELGMYWKENQASWYWYQAPIETQALMIEVFSEVGLSTKDEPANINDIDNLKIWLLKNKQTNKWETTKATTKAVYALLLSGSDWLSVTEIIEVKIGGEQISVDKLEGVKVEAGTGYYKTSWSGSDITPEMARVELHKKGDGIAWGALYWQYFEDLDEISSADTPLSVKKKIFKKTNTDRGEQIFEVKPETNLKVGDLVRVRIELKTDRDMEFIHMKDMRAAGLEPVNVISEYKYQDGLGYYQSTKDASTNFFFDYLPKGVYIFEYDLRVNNAGNMSNGLTTVESMYAPEFKSHSEGMRISVD